MRVKPLLPVLLLGAALLALAVMPAAADSTSKPTTAPADAAKIAKLIEQLGSDTFEERKKASEALDAIGEPALEALRKATRSSDAETRKRASDLVARIEKRVNTARVLDPTMVHLVFKDTPIEKAVEEISKKTGFTIKLHDPDGKLKGKKITLDTGKTSFWNALGQFCDKAGLVDGDPNRANMGRPVPPPLPPIGVPGGKPAPGIKPAPPAPLPPVRREKEARRREAPVKQVDKKETVKVNPGVRVGIAAQARPAILPAQPAVPIGPAIAVPAPGFRWINIQHGEIYLFPGKPVQKAADTSSSIRVRPADSKLTAFMPGDKDHLFLALEVSPEPRLRWHQLLSVKVDRAVDDNDQKLVSVDPQAGMLNGPGIGVAFPGGGPVRIMPFPIWGGSGGMYHYAPVKFKKGDKETKSLKELSGTLSAQVLDRAEPMLVIDKLMKAAGKSVKGKKDGELKINKVTKAGDGTITIEFEMEMPANVSPETRINIPAPPGMLPGIRPPLPPRGVPVPAPAVPPAARKVPDRPANNAQAAETRPAVPARPGVVVGGRVGIGIAVQPGGIAVPFPIGPMTYAMNGLTLQDEKGKPLYAVIQMDWKKGGFGFPGGPQKKMSYIATYRPVKGQPAEPARLVFTGRTVLEVSVPFTLKNVTIK